MYFGCHLIPTKSWSMCSEREYSTTDYQMGSEKTALKLASLVLMQISVFTTNRKIIAPLKTITEQI